MLETAIQQTSLLSLGFCIRAELTGEREEVSEECTQCTQISSRSEAPNPPRRLLLLTSAGYRALSRKTTGMVGGKSVEGFNIITQQTELSLLFQNKCNDSIH